MIKPAMTQASFNQHVEVCRYFFRANVMKKRLEAMIVEHGGEVAAVEAEWDEFWAYYCFWLSGLWVACEGVDRIKFGDQTFQEFAKACRSKLRPVRQATFHYKPSTSQMMEHLDSVHGLTELRALHDTFGKAVAAFLHSAPQEYVDAMPDQPT